MLQCLAEQPPQDEVCYCTDEQGQKTGDSQYSYYCKPYCDLTGESGLWAALVPAGMAAAVASARWIDARRGGGSGGAGASAPRSTAAPRSSSSPSGSSGAARTATSVRLGMTPLLESAGVYALEALGYIGGLLVAVPQNLGSLLDAQLKGMQDKEQGPV